MNPSLARLASPEANLGRETQSWLARPTSSGRRSHASLEAILVTRELTVTTYMIDLPCNYEKAVCVPL
jgi:hypothetical protein